MEKIASVLRDQLQIAQKASLVLQESILRVGPILAKADSVELTPSEREACEALTSRFSRLADYLVIRLFRTIDEAELIYEGTLIDRLNRMEKRGLIHSATEWRDLRVLRNDIAHEYLLDEARRTLKRALLAAPLLVKATTDLEAYCKSNKLF